MASVRDPTRLAVLAAIGSSVLAYLGHPPYGVK